MGAQLQHKEEVITFKRRQSHDLSKLLRSLTLESQNAVDVLVTLLKSKDEKIRMAAAGKLLDMQVQVSELKNRDEVQRLLAEVKYGPKSLVADGEGDSPMLDFSRIQDVD